MVRAERGKLWTEYARAGVISTARMILGESAYGRARNLGKGA